MSTNNRDDSFRAMLPFAQALVESIRQVFGGEDSIVPEDENFELAMQAYTTYCQALVVDNPDRDALYRMGRETIYAAAGWCRASSKQDNPVAAALMSVIAKMHDSASHYFSATVISEQPELLKRSVRGSVAAAQAQLCAWKAEGADQKAAWAINDANVEISDRGYNDISLDQGQERQDAVRAIRLDEIKQLRELARDARCWADIAWSNCAYADLTCAADAAAASLERRVRYWEREYSITN